MTGDGENRREGVGNGGFAILVTGATDGLGRMAARDLAAGGATVLLHGRRKERAEATVREIREETSNDSLRYYLADLSSLDEVRKLADEIRSDQDRLDVLINNAGIGAGKRDEMRREESEDGHELRFAVNYLAPFLLTGLLLPLLEDSAPARIVNVASAGQSSIDFDDVMLERGYDGMRAYSQSKLAQIMFTFSLAEHQEGTGVAVGLPHEHQDGLRVVRLHDEHRRGGRGGGRAAGYLTGVGRRDRPVLRRAARGAGRQPGLRSGGQEEALGLEHGAGRAQIGLCALTSSSPGLCSPQRVPPGRTS